MKFGKLLLISVFAFAVLGAVGCAKSVETESEEVAAFDAMSVDSLSRSLPDLVGDTVVVDGICSHICRHGATKAFLINADTTSSLLCKATSSIGGAFAPDCPGKKLTVVGVVRTISRGEECVNHSDTCEFERDTTLAVGYYLDAISYATELAD